MDNSNYLYHSQDSSKLIIVSQFTEAYRNSSIQTYKNENTPKKKKLKYTKSLLVE